MKISERITGGIVAAVCILGLTAGGVFLASATPTTDAPVSKVVSAPEVNGLAAEQEAAAAQVEAERIAAEAAAAEAARVAAEQAAAAQAEADRIVAEQAVDTEAETFESSDEPAPKPEPEPEEFTGPLPGTQVHTICAVLDDGTQVPCQH